MNFRVLERPPYVFGQMKLPDVCRWGGVDHIEVLVETDYDALNKLMPQNIKLITPHLHVYQNTYKEYSYNGGRAYNFFGIGIDGMNVSGPAAGQPGWYIPVCWMDDPISIIAGRDSKAVTFPKLYGELMDPIRTMRGGLYCAVAEYGHKLIEIEMYDMVEIPDDQRPQPKGTVGFSYWLLDNGPCPAFQRTDEIWTGKGEVKFNKSTWDQAPAAYYVANWLSNLPNLKVIGASRNRGAIELGALGELPKQYLEQHKKAGIPVEEGVKQYLGMK